ncbi:MAG: tetratricopeptide repeat protein [Defluviitaleaceae bacterium]|nr:tetratricopeptide repeat protein [Defluviitaleaceae bacterium]
MKASKSLPLGHKIMQIRNSKGLSQDNVALAIGRNNKFVSRIENGQTEISPAVLEGLRRYLKVESAPLLDYELELYEQRLWMCSEMLDAFRIEEAKKRLHDLASILDLPYEYNLIFIYSMLEIRLLFAEANIPEAEKKLGDIEHLVDKASDRALYIYHMNKGYIYTFHQYHKHALYHYEKARELIGDSKPEMKLLTNLGVAYYNRGNVYHAIRYYERAIEEYQGDNVNIALPNTKKLLALCYVRIGENSKAIKILDTVIPQMKIIGGNAMLGEALQIKGVVSHNEGNYDEAITIFDEALEHLKIDKRAYVHALSSKTVTLRKLKRFADVQKAIETTRLMAADNERLSMILDSAGCLASLRDPDSIRFLEDVAISYYRDLGGIHNYMAIDICRELKDHYDKKKSKINALTISDIMRQIYDELYFHE